MFHLNSEGEEEEFEEEDYDDEEEGIEEEYDDEEDNEYGGGVSRSDNNSNNFKKIKTDYSSNEDENAKGSPKKHDYAMAVKPPTRKVSSRRRSEDSDDCLSNSI